VHFVVRDHQIELVARETLERFRSTSRSLNGVAQLFENRLARAQSMSVVVDYKDARVQCC
jgi:hypothetical protein